jgi:hypothetical protein
MKLLITFSLLIFLLSCEKSSTNTSELTSLNHTPPIESRILCLNQGNNEFPGLVQLYFPRLNILDDLLFTSNLGIKIMFEYNTNFYALTDHNVFQFTNDFNNLEPIYEIEEFDEVKLFEGILYFYSVNKTKMTAINIVNGSKINELTLKIKPVDFEIFEDKIYLMSTDSLFLISLIDKTLNDSLSLLGISKNIEIQNDSKAYILSKEINNEIIMELDLNSFRIIKVSQLLTNHTHRNFKIDQRIGVLTSIANQTHFYHGGLSSDYQGLSLFIDHPYFQISSFVYLIGKNDFIFADNRYGLEKGKISHYHFHGVFINEIETAYNPSQLLVIN